MKLNIMIARIFWWLVIQFEVRKFIKTTFDPTHFKSTEKGTSKNGTLS